MGAITSQCCYEQNNKQKRYDQVTLNKKITSCSSTPTKLKQSVSTNMSSIKSLADFPTNNDFQGKSQAQEYRSSQDQYQVDKNKKLLSLNDFIVKGQIGSGTFGNVYLVHLKSQYKHQNPVKYALKKICKEDFANSKTQENTRLQMQVMTSLGNPFLTQLKFAFADTEAVYLVMEFAAGGSIQTLLSIKQIINKKNQRIKMFAQCGQYGVKFITANVILGLEHLHQNQVIYRDLKPENVIIFEDGYVKLADFGLTRILQGNQQTRTEAGTILYFPPEMVLRQGYNKMIDFWQLGVFIYELSTSKSPFRKDQILTRHKFKDIIIQFENSASWKQVKLSEGLKDLIIKLLKFNPQQRLGANGFYQLKNHPFFHDINWQQLPQKKLKSPLLAIIKNSPLRPKDLKSNSSIKKLAVIDQKWNYDYRCTQ